MQAHLIWIFTQMAQTSRIFCRKFFFPFAFTYSRIRFIKLNEFSTRNHFKQSNNQEPFRASSVFITPIVVPKTLLRFITGLDINLNQNLDILQLQILFQLQMVRHNAARESSNYLWSTSRDNSPDPKPGCSTFDCCLLLLRPISNPVEPMGEWTNAWMKLKCKKCVIKRFFL